MANTLAYYDEAINIVYKYRLQERENVIFSAVLSLESLRIITLHFKSKPLSFKQRPNIVIDSCL